MHEGLSALESNSSACRAQQRRRVLASRSSVDQPAELNSSGIRDLAPRSPVAQPVELNSSCRRVLATRSPVAHPTELKQLRRVLASSSPVAQFAEEGLSSPEPGSSACRAQQRRKVLTPWSLVAQPAELNSSRRRVLVPQSLIAQLVELNSAGGS